MIIRPCLAAPPTAERLHFRETQKTWRVGDGHGVMDRKDSKVLRPRLHCRVSTLCYVSTFRDGKRPSGEGRGARARSVARPASALWGGDCDVTVGCAPRRQLN